MALLSLREVGVEPAGFDVDDPIWDRASWLDDLRDVPSEAVWPRLMTVPHPRAVGTLGPEFERSLVLTSSLRWFQRLASYRVLEVDADGLLVWDAWIKTLARQLGKSWWLSELFLWRVRQGDRFDGPQDCLHIADRLRTAKEVQRRARTWCKARKAEWAVREANESVEIELRSDGSRWILRAGDAVYSFSGSLGVVDEAWKIKQAIVEEGLAPTLVEREQGQLGLVSTAHRAATQLMVGRRQDALERLHTGEGDLLLEWSTPRSMDIGDVEGWRLASPHWTARRERLIAGAYARAMKGLVDEAADEPDPIEAFRAQWLNQWPLPRNELDDVVPKIDQAAWRRIAVHRPPSLAPGEVVLAFAVHNEYSDIAVAAGTLERGYVECTDHKSGTNWLGTRLVALARKWRPQAIGFDAGSAIDSAAMAEVRERFAVAGIDVDLLTPLTSAAYRVACGGFDRAVIDGSVSRPWIPDEKPDALRAAGEVAEAKAVGADGFVWDMRSSLAPLGPLKAVTIARSLLSASGKSGPEQLEGSLMA